jgi:hypothetical protein
MRLQGKKPREPIQKGMIRDKGLCDNLLVVVYGTWPEYQPRFALAALEARPKESIKDD